MFVIGLVIVIVDVVIVVIIIVIVIVIVMCVVVVVVVEVSLLSLSLFLAFSLTLLLRKLVNITLSLLSSLSSSLLSLFSLSSFCGALAASLRHRARLRDGAKSPQLEACAMPERGPASARWRSRSGRRSLVIGRADYCWALDRAAVAGAACS